MSKGSGKGIKIKSIIYEEKNTKANLCQICCEREIIRVKNFYADCRHQIACRKCSQAQLLRCISLKQELCCLKEGCSAKVLEPHKQTSLIPHFSTTTIQKYREYTSKRAVMDESKINGKPCKIPDCKGKIVSGKCKKCTTYYCLFCHEIQHPVDVKCKSKEDRTTSGGGLEANVECPKCGQRFFKEKGCLHLKCSYKNCNYEWCQVCNKKWNKLHHACGIKTLLNLQ